MSIIMLVALSRLGSVHVGHVDILDHGVDTADTLAVRDFDEDEAFVAPALSPGVLNLPVVVQSLLVCQASTA